MKTYLAARREAGSPRGIDYAARLAAMPPTHAADEIEEMFRLCAPEDLTSSIAEDLQLPIPVARRIARVIRRRWRFTRAERRLRREQQMAEGCGPLDLSVPF